MYLIAIDKQPIHQPDIWIIIGLVEMFAHACWYGTI